MGIINVLTPNVYNKISAGEVVDSPSGVVKELVENSIDAGASNISIEITDSGLTKMLVCDDGSGILKEDLLNAFKPHATSKLSKEQDLENIMTLGFRGEALASISAVSQVTLLSKTKEEDVGFEIKVNGGDFEPIIQKGCNTGTMIIVENLFYNTPARRKFLKSERSEGIDITKVVVKQILSHPNISFKYTLNDKLIYNHRGGELKDAIYTIFGKEFLDSLIEINKTNANGFNVSGFVGEPNCAKNNTSWQYIFVNNRSVESPLIQTAVKNAMEDYLMKGKYPYYIIKLSVPSDSVDVNIHPKKNAVKFENSDEIFGLFFGAIKSCLDKYRNVLHVEDNTKVDEPITLEELPKNAGVSFGQKIIEKNKNIIEPIFRNSIDQLSQQTIIENKLDINNIKNDDNINKNIDFNALNTQININNETYDKTSPITQTIKSENKLDSIENEKDIKQEKIFSGFHGKVIGTIFDTYIIIQQDDNVIFMDQHAAHERVMYDKFNKQYEEKKLITQDLIVPYIVNTNYSESQMLENSLGTLKDMGFDVSSFGQNSFKVSTVPLPFIDIDLKAFFDDLLSSTIALSETNEKLKKIIATKACKAAVKAGMVLRQEEIDYLLNLINTSTTPLRCPHGRPIAVTFSQNELEKWFKRIV
jgi:DNA mismatch repair protein MutL